IVKPLDRSEFSSSQLLISWLNPAFGVGCSMFLISSILCPLLLTSDLYLLTSSDPQTEGGFPSAVIRNTGSVLLSIASGGVWTRRSCAKTGSPINITEMRTTVPDCDSSRNHFIAALNRTLLRSAQRIRPPEPNSRP